MALFRITKTSIDPVPEATFAGQGVKERSDLQRLLKANIAVVAPDVLVIAEEFAEWEESRRRIDLLAVDREGQIVVIELKRDDDCHMELQAVRYAAMVSSMTFARAAEVYQTFLDAAGQKGDARALLLEFLGWDEPREDRFGQDVRIVLVAADFSKELTTAVLWLNERDLDIRCVRLRPYALGGETVIDAQQVVPLPEAEAYTIQLKQKEQAVRQEADQTGVRHAFWNDLIRVAANVTPRFAGASPGFNWIGASSGLTGLRWAYLLWQGQCGCELYIDKGADSTVWNKTAFDYLHARREQIEGAFGGQLTWYRLPDKRACRIMDVIPGGITAPRETWPTLRDAMIDSMRRFELALSPHLPAAIAAASRKPAPAPEVGAAVEVRSGGAEKPTPAPSQA